MLIAPVYEKGATSRDVYLPAGTWYDWWDNARHDGGTSVTRKVDLATMPIYVRAGSIIPFDPVRQYMAQPVTEPTTLKVYTGANGEFTMYEDDGNSQELPAEQGHVDQAVVGRRRQETDDRGGAARRSDQRIDRRAGVQG